MFEAAAIDGAAAAFVAGLATSPHCAVMCGPLTCVLGGAGPSAGALAAYHLGRAVAYGVCGAALAWLGGGAMAMFEWPGARILPWVLVALFLGLAFRLDRFLPKPSLVAPGLHAAVLRGIHRRPELAGAGLGLLTPLLPCGPLYAVLGISFFASSPARGAEIAVAFAIGTMPLLWAAQASARFLGRTLPPWVFTWTRQGLALVAAGLIAWRLLLPGGVGDLVCH